MFQIDYMQIFLSEPFNLSSTFEDVLPFVLVCCLELILLLLSFPLLTKLSAVVDRYETDMEGLLTATSFCWSPEDVGVRMGKL